MKTIIKTIGVLGFLLLTITVNAQKKPYYTEQEEVIEAAYKQLDYSMKEGLLYEWKTERNPTGSYTMRLTIKGKGEVVTVSTVDRKEGDIPTQNSLKNFIKTYRFPFKMPKNKSYQFVYEFKF